MRDIFLTIWKNVRYSRTILHLIRPVKKMDSYLSAK